MHPAAAWGCPPDRLAGRIEQNPIVRRDLAVEAPATPLVSAHAISSIAIVACAAGCRALVDSARSVDVRARGVPRV